MLRIIRYLRSHLSVSIVLELLVPVIVLAVAFQVYLRAEYYAYIQDAGRDTEEAVLDVVKSSANDSLHSLTDFGIGIALSSDISDILLDESLSATTRSYQLQQELAAFQYPEEVVCVAIADKDGVVEQYDMYSSANIGLLMWSDDNNDVILDLYEKTNARFLEKGAQSWPKFIVSVEERSHPARSDLQIFHVGIPMIHTMNGDGISYIIILTLRFDLFEDEMEMINVPRISYAQGMVTDEDGTVLYSDDGAMIGRNVADYDWGDGAVYETSVGYFGWQLFVWLDESQMKEYIYSIFASGFAVYLLVIVAASILVLLMIRRLFRPIGRIAEAMRAVRSPEGEHPRIPISGSNEIWQLAEEYNQMADRVEEKNREAQEQHENAITALERAHDAEREAMASQIDAHFICNTLGVINYEAVDAGDTKASVLIKKLSNILRYTFDQKTREVSLRQEIAWTEQYLYLQKERFEDKFVYEVHTDERYDDWPCLKLMMQPFVENSIIHGFEGMRQGGRILICAQEQGGRLQLTISDNGCGMDEEMRGKIQYILDTHGMDRTEQGSSGRMPTGSEHGTGVGIRNVVAHLYLYYGDRLEIMLQTGPGEGCVYTFLLPLPAGWEEDAEEEAE